MNIDKKKVGEKIHAIRKQHGYSMEQFGKQIGNAPRGSVNSWEKGVNLPNKERLELIAIMGNTTSDELLYGSLNDYVSDLIVNNLGIKISHQFIYPFVEMLKSRGFTYGDDVEILRFAQGFFNANNIATRRPSLFYSPISTQDNLFIGYLETAPDTKIPKYFVFSDIKKNTLHITTYTLNKDSSYLYTYPSTMTNSGEHDYFTSGLMVLQLNLRNLTLIYYGIDTELLEVQIFQFNYDAESDSLILNTEKIDSSELYAPFEESIKKELLYLKYSIHKDNTTVG